MNIMRYVKQAAAGLLGILAIWAALFGVAWMIANRDRTSAQKFGCVHTHINQRGEDTGECN